MLKETQFTIKGFVVWGVCALFFLYEFFLRASIGTFQHSLMQDLQLSVFQYALLSTTIFSVMYGIMQIPVGLLVEHFGLKRVLTVGALLCAISCFMFACATTYFYAASARMLMGMGASVGFLCLLVAVSEWMPHGHMALFIGLSQFIGTMGPMLGAGPLEEFSSTAHVSWQAIFYALGGGGIFLSILVMCFVENNQWKS